MARASCSRCSAPIPRKTSGDALCERCEAEDRVLLSEVLSFLKEGEGCSRYQYELTDLDGIDEARLRRWVRIGAIEKGNMGKLQLIGKVKRNDRRSIVQIYQKLLEPSPIPVGELQGFSAQLATEELVIGDGDGESPETPSEPPSET